jgi:hypothetical protein
MTRSAPAAPQARGAHAATCRRKAAAGESDDVRHSRHRCPTSARTCEARLAAR